MYARVARWEGADAEEIRGAVARMKERTGPPEGVPGKGFLLLTDPDSGTALAIGLFATEEDRAEGDRVLNEMNPPGGGMGTRASVEMYEVGVAAGAAEGLA